MVKAKIGDKVKVHYTGKLEDGTVFDSSREGEPLEFTIGSGEIIPGFEEQIIGMEEGEKKTFTIPPEKAYGPHREELIIEVRKEEFPPDITPEVGQHLQLRQADGHVFYVVVTDVQEDSVTLDANHPLAGKDLVFDVELLEVSSA
ncbi:MAG: peptidylprolyl isomerase [Candidatus Aminicenantes bacterium]|nr:peptidylprolyl isomerase [Candidatus Aminicenantes bacterium]